jgi:Zn finger protein HypA/HybF involved in hydrogenase expression
MRQVGSIAMQRSVGEHPMRELSIAQSVVDMAAQHAAGRRVTRVEVSVGSMRQVDAESLHMAFDLVTFGTALDGAQLRIARVAGADLQLDALELDGSA